MIFYTHKKIIHKIVLLLFVFIGFNAFGQNAVLVREAVQDSSEYFGNLKNVNDALFYTGGAIRPPRNFRAHTVPRDFYREAHVYKYDVEQDDSQKLFQHDLENGYKPPERQKLDSCRLYNYRIFIPFSDTSGVFIQHLDYATDYWVKKRDDYERIVLPHKKSIWHKHRWFDGKLLIGGRDPLVPTRMWYIDTSDFQLKSFLNDTLTYGAGICGVYDEYIIFTGFSRRHDGSDLGLFITDKNGTINRLGSYPWGTTSPKYVGVFKGKIMYTLASKDSKGNYDNTELWEYDIGSSTSRKVYEFDRYGIVYSAYEFDDDLYFTFGLREQKMYKLSEGDITKNDESGILNYIFSYPKLTNFNNKKYFIGIDNEDVRRLYTIDKTDKIKLVSKEHSPVRYFHIIGNRLIFTTNENADEDCLRFYQIIEGSDKIEQITDVCLANNYDDYKRYKSFTVGNSIYVAFRYDTEPKKERYQKTETGDVIVDPFHYEKRELPQIDLFRLEDSELKLVKADIKSVKYYLVYRDFVDMAIINDELYVVSRANKKDSFNQLWKITNEKN